MIGYRRLERALWDLGAQLRLIESFGIGPTDLVLDVGSGQAPNLRADVLCDYFLTDHSERACGAQPVVDRPLVVADAERLPFRDGAFDFVVCSHLLEHVRRPRRLLSELERVSRRGYIETPSRVHEQLYGNPFHKWFVSLEDGELRLSPKPAAQLNGEASTWFRRRYQENDRFRDLINRHLDVLGFLVRYQWSDEIRFTIEGDLPEEADFVFAQLPVAPASSGNGLLTAGQKARSLLGRWLRRHNRVNRQKLVDLLRCSLCAGALSGKDALLHCAQGHQFPVKGHLFYLAEHFAGQGGIA
jgi:SAM-dependent methyltransferase